MNVSINRTLCVSCGSCWDSCPGLFEQDPDDSFSRITEHYRVGGNTAEGAPPEEMEECAHDASDLCPVQIITVID